MSLGLEFTVLRKGETLEADGAEWHIAAEAEVVCTLTENDSRFTLVLEPAAAKSAGIALLRMAAKALALRAGR
jgi:hypothetical protein